MCNETQNKSKTVIPYRAANAHKALFIVSVSELTKENKINFKINNTKQTTKFKKNKRINFVEKKKDDKAK